MNDNMEINGKAVPKVHRPPSMIFRDDGNPAFERINNPGIYKCVDYRIPRHGDLVYLASEDGVFDATVLWDVFMASYGQFPRVIVERIPERAIDAGQTP